jgi:signal transduction histidine kinase
MTPALLTAVGWCAAALLGGIHVRTRQRLVLVARASHELRGPLCAARLGLGTIAGEPGRVAAIDLELARAGRALDDLAAAPSGARRRERRERVDLAGLARGYASAWTTLAGAHGAGFVLEIDEAPASPIHRSPARPRHLCAVPGTPSAVWPEARPRPCTAVLADPFRVAQAVANLVSNAAEHGGGVVRVRVRGRGERVWIEVADDGPGLPAPVGALAAAARTRRGRRGHGLAIAAGIAEHLGGRLAALPARAGARLVLDLPAAR